LLKREAPFCISRPTIKQFSSWPRAHNHVASFFFDPVAFDSRASPATSLHSICPSFSRRINQAQLKKWPSTFHADDVPHAAAGGSEIGVGVVEGAAALAIMKAGPLIGISPPLGLKNLGHPDEAPDARTAVVRHVQSTRVTCGFKPQRSYAFGGGNRMATPALAMTGRTT